MIKSKTISGLEIKNGMFIQANGGTIFLVFQNKKNFYLLSMKSGFISQYDFNFTLCYKVLILD